MKEVSEKKNNFIFALIMAALLFLQLLTLVYYGNKKAGFHEDELYTYYSSNKTAGLFVNDRQWLDCRELKKEFTVLPGERFRYNIVKQMQSWDVHPPFYYYLFHTAASLQPGVFSKWTGIGVNLIAYALSYLLLAYGAYAAAGEDKRGRLLAFLTCLAWGFGGAVISGVLFIRMYEWLTVFVLLCMDLHLRAMKKQDFGIKRFLLPIGLTVFLGFLAQYYYIIFHFFMGAAFCFLLLKNRKFKELIAYGAACGLGFLGAVLYYPASMSHIFRGYRGTEAVSEFSNASNTWERLRFFYGLFDDYMMSGTLSLWLLVICVLLVTAGYLRKRGKAAGVNGAAGLLLFTCAGYFFTVSKTALLLGETSNRYQLPIYGILLFLILYGAWTLALEFLPKNRRAKGILAGILVLAVLCMDGLALKNGRVFFLYEEEKEVMEFVRENSGGPVAVFYNDASPDNIWRLSDELMEFEKVYLASQGNAEPIDEKEIIESRHLLVYVADYEGQEECVYRLLEAAPYLDSCRIAARKGLWTLYELS
ncbi:MAG: hypothetical protein NC400_00155 [Clostridium sp.]|nr:hypothetical protein [Clostridium sp.]